MNINEISDTNKLDLDAIKFYETVVPDSTDVMEVANSWEGGGYVWGGGSGLGIPLMWNNPKTGKEEVLKDKQDKGTYCSGYALQVGYIVAKNRKILQNKTKSQLLTFMKEWYQSYPKTCVTAIINLGIGNEIKLEDAEEGDFCQLWRTNDSGHNVIFKKFLYKDEKIIGIEYRSTQPKTNGIGDNKEYFTNGGGKIKKDSTYFVRLNK
jgi:hypothetical protein